MLRDLPRLDTAPDFDPDCFGEGEYEFANSLAQSIPPIEHPFALFNDYRQHDAAILDCSFERDCFKITIGRHDLAQLYGTCTTEYGSWEKCSVQFPSAVQFTDVHDFQVLRFCEQGVYQRVRATQKALGKLTHSVRRILCLEWTETRKRIIIEAHSLCRALHRIPNAYDFSYVNSYFICADCGDITISENWRGDWIRLFGESKVGIYDAFVKDSTENLRGSDDYFVWVLENGFGELLGWELPDWFQQKI